MKKLAVLAATALLALNVSALNIEYSAFTLGVNMWTTDQNANLEGGGNPPNVGPGSTLQTAFGVNIPGLEFILKNDNNNTTYNPGDLSGFSPIYLYLKDGQNIPAAYLLNVSAVYPAFAGGEITLSGFWDGDMSKLSHSTVLGVPGNSVPDGGATVALLGAALAGLGTLRRFIKW